MAPVQVVIVVEACVEQDSGQLPQVVEAFVNVDDGIEAQPTVPDLLDDFAAREGDRKVDVERWVSGFGE